MRIKLSYIYSNPIHELKYITIDVAQYTNAKKLEYFTTTQHGAFII